VCSLLTIAREKSQRMVKQKKAEASGSKINTSKTNRKKRDRGREGDVISNK